MDVIFHVKSVSLKLAKLAAVLKSLRQSSDLDRNMQIRSGSAIRTNFFVICVTVCHVLLNFNIPPIPTFPHAIVLLMR